MLDAKLQRPLRLAAITLIVAGVIVLLIVAKNILIPIVVAAILAYAIIALSGLLQRMDWFGRPVPQWLTYLLSIVIIGIITWGAWTITQSHIGLIINQIPFYQAQLATIFISLSESLGIDVATQISQGIASVNIGGMVGGLVGSVANLGSKFILVIIYTIFIIIEFPSIKNKIRYFFRNHAEEKKHTKHVLSRINHDVSTYFKIKTFASFLTALLCFVVLLLFGVDFAIFWALIVFVLNFIPTIGSIIAVFFPAVLALVQFGSFGLFIAVLLSLIVMQLLVGNVIEPRIAGKVLDISPLVILIALVVAGALWGPVGMIISVPIVIVAKIITAEFGATRLLSVLLSRTGENTS